eukprot:6928794-Prymnesium_polylepis.1
MSLLADAVVDRCSALVSWLPPTPPPVVVVTFATALPPTWLLGASAVARDIPVVVIGLGRPWGGMGVAVVQKFSAVRRALQILRRIIPTSAIIIADAWDTMVVNGVSAATASTLADIGQSRRILVRAHTCANVVGPRAVRRRERLPHASSTRDDSRARCASPLAGERRVQLVASLLRRPPPARLEGRTLSGDARRHLLCQQRDVSRPVPPQCVCPIALPLTKGVDSVYPLLLSRRVAVSSRAQRSAEDAACLCAS